MIGNRSQSEIIGFLVALVILYLLFDFFIWNGGLVDPAIFTRLDRALS
jgi:hypothetical protein